MIQQTFLPSIHTSYGVEPNDTREYVVLEQRPDPEDSSKHISKVVFGPDGLNTTLQAITDAGAYLEGANPEGISYILRLAELTEPEPVIT
mgnify:CR=1 FL=1